MSSRKAPRQILADKPNASVRAKLIAFAHMYRGGDDSVRGNSVACYKELHPKASDATANTKASGYLNHPIVQEILEAKAAEVCEQADITETYVVTKIHETVERCSQARPVYDRTGKPAIVETPDGELAPAYTFDANAVLKGCELLGKKLKLWTDKVEADVNGGQTLSDLLKQARDESE